MNSTQQPIQITKPMWIVIAVVMGAVLLGKLDQREVDQEPVEPGRSTFISEDLSVARRDNETTTFAELGIAITPADGWTCLAIENREMPFRFTFVNQSKGMIARITRFPNIVWPPELRLKKTVPLTPKIGPDSTPQQEFPKERPVTMETRIVPVETERYEHFSIGWIRLLNSPSRGAERRIGRIETDETAALITLVSLRKEPGQEASIRSFCNQIQPIGDL